MLKEYQYAPLETTSIIRVIKIQEQKVNNEVACVIRHVDRTEFVYEALSYVWGDPQPNRHAYLGNEADKKYLFPLHENLWRFLNWAWGRQMFDRWIWTDRMCLNQDDEEEMAQQIQNMGEVFQDAKHTLSWLDLSEQDGEDIAYLRDCAVKDSDRKRTPHKTQQVANRIRENEYWGRVWIAQEVCRAKRVIVLIGKTEMEFKSLRNRTCGYGEVLSSISPMDALYFLDFCEKRKTELWELLHWMIDCGFKCSRPQDRVYGILGFIKPNDDGTSPTDHIHVNYERSASEVLLDAVLESRPPLTGAWNFEDTASLLRGRGGAVTMPIFNLFEKYLGSQLTSKRHKELARYTFQVWDALDELVYISGGRPDSLPMYTGFEKLLERLHRSRFQATLRDSAIITGIALLLGFREEEEASTFETGKAYDKHHRRTSSAWQCAGHDPGFAPPKDYSGDLKGSARLLRIRCLLRGRPYREERLRGQASASAKLWEDFWNPSQDPDRIAKACAKHETDGALCDTSSMRFEIPEAGFRMVFEFDTKGRGRLPQMCIQFFHPKAAQEKGGGGDGQDTAA